MKHSESALKDALWENKQEELSLLPAEDEIEHEFSDRFNRKMKKLLRSEKRGTASAAARKAKKIAAVIIAVILALVVSTTADAWIEKLFDLVYRIHDSIVKVDYEDDDRHTNKAGEEVAPLYFMIPTIPDGFEAQYRYIINGYVDALWENESTGEHISFSQGGAVSSKHNKDELMTEEFDLNGIHVLCLKDPNRVYCYWSQDGYHFSLSYPTRLGDEFMKKTVGKLTVYENRNEVPWEKGSETTATKP